MHDKDKPALDDENQDEDEKINDIVYLGWIKCIFQIPFSFVRYSMN